ncbi:PLDc_N domain-containing protein [Arthrobacter sp. MSA 4-2]|uniref:PLD nuclease N-terminal domain-containing protein n=1 Tax=Arthrobacter sp. MSA 4-2 TaxID=2794349 RepID=UPI001A33D3C7|nr:PLD nuclease N-terminal domain-containing protein [Arthrobacter sp. MSA 4-2]MBJ2122468.1 PLDc_N domain-containing protein [Arthrobacter sp. MSA 4-2]
MVATAEDSLNPVIPDAWELSAQGAGALAVAIVVVALISIARSRHLTSTAQAVWVLIVLAFPILGPASWFVVGRRSAAPTPSNLQSIAPTTGNRDGR